MPQTSRAVVGDEAIDFTLQSIDGSTLNLRDQRGEQAVILVFFRGAW
jgi:peroxiredoxin